MRGLTSTLVLVVLLAGLGGYIYFVDSKRPAPGIDGETREKVFSLETEKVNEVRVTYVGDSSLLKKDAAGWKMVEPVQTDADPAEAASLAQALANIEMTRPVDDNPADLKEFGLDPPAISVEFKAEGNVSGSLKLGGMTATAGDMYAQKGGEKRVFLVSGFQETNFNRTPFDLRDKKILKFERDKADHLALARGGETLELTRDGADWKVVKPTAARSDATVVEGLLTKLATSNMSTLVEDGAEDLAQYGLDKPSLVVTVGAGSAKTVLEVGKTDGDKTYARDQARPLVFTLDTTLQGDLDKGFDDYKRKDLFDFRAFSVDRIRAVLDAPGGPKAYDFEKVAPAKDTDPRVWRLTVAGAAPRDVDAAAMEDLIAKVSALRVESFAKAGTRTGIEKPALVVSASFDGGKFERVRFGQAGEEAFGARDGEGAGPIARSAMEAAMLAIDTVVMPPKPAAAPDKAGEKP